MGLVADAEMNDAPGTWSSADWGMRYQALCRKAESTQSRFFANARPECDFKYRSNSRALYLSGKAQYQTSSQGINFAVWVDFPAL